MAGSVNKVILVGNLGRDPEVRATQSGGKIVNLAVATSESWTDRATSERKERTEWHRVVIFNEGIAGVAERFLQKGSRVYLEGTLQTRKWTDKDGAEKYSTEIVLGPFNSQMTLLDARNGGEGGNGGAQDGRGGAGGGQGNPSGGQRGGQAQGASGGPQRTNANLASKPLPQNSNLDDEIPF